MAKREEASVQFVAIQRLERAEVTLYLLGTSPLVMNRVPAKAKRQLLWPARQMNKAARELVQKHDPYAEYRDCVYRCRDDKAPTLFHFPNGAFKKAMAQAAIDTPGATKAETGRLVKVIDETVHVYGRPFLYMAIVKQAGINKTPDIRTRAIFPEWCCKITIRYIRTRIREQDIVNLLQNAGDITGIGDGRTEKGTFDNGSWELVLENDAKWRKIAKEQGRKVQLEAMNKPVAIDEDTEELLAWFDAEVIRREAEPKAPKAKKAAARKAASINGEGEVDGNRIQP